MDTTIKISRKNRVRLLRVSRFFGKILGKLIKKEEMTDHQKMGLRIFEQTVSIKDVDIFLSPLSDVIYIQTNDIYLRVEGYTLNVVNGMYNHEFQYTDVGRKRMINRVFNILERRREEIEARIKTKHTRTIDAILGDLQKIKKESHQ